ncbi:hypothetical protein ON010_g5363 [Phytophthora cinnamomi]|nr:hypothetical protein ON010_g5363 [Phytophthora cinnamomi]
MQTHEPHASSSPPSPLPTPAAGTEPPTDARTEAGDGKLPTNHRVKTKSTLRTVVGCGGANLVPVKSAMTVAMKTSC